jgi:hypothetical protein
VGAFVIVARGGQLVRPAVFGVSDGMMSILGVVLYLSGHQSLVLPAAAIGGVSSGSRSGCCGRSPVGAPGRWW